MFRAKYLGDHDNFSAWGIRFPLGVFVPVSDEHAQKKISTNSHFEVENSDAEDVAFVETLKAEFVAEESAPVDIPQDMAVATEPEVEVAETQSERQKRPYNRRK